MAYCHKHEQGLATGRCLICDSEAVDAGIQADKDKIAELEEENKQLKKLLIELGCVDINMEKPEQDDFCDSNCTWLDHHRDCKIHVAIGYVGVNSIGEVEKFRAGKFHGGIAVYPLPAKL